MQCGDRIKEVRIENGLSQAGLAAILQVNSSYISRLESGSSNPSSRLLQAISSIFLINVDWLTTGDGDKHDLSDSIDKVIGDNPDLRRKKSSLDAQSIESMRLRRIFFPAFHNHHNLREMTDLLEDEEAKTFRLQLNLLIIEWNARKDRARERLEGGIAAIIPDYDKRIIELRAIADRQWLELPDERQQARVIKPVALPMLGRAAAGLPIDMYELPDEAVESDGDEILHGDFVVVAVGESMTDAGIRDGDYCVIRPTPTVFNGTIALVAVNDGSTIKRFYNDGDVIRLEPCNPDFETQRYDASTQIRILGRFIKTIKRD